MTIAVIYRNEVTHGGSFMVSPFLMKPNLFNSE